MPPISTPSIRMPPEYSLVFQEQMYIDGNSIIPQDYSCHLTCARDGDNVVQFNSHIHILEHRMRTACAAPANLINMHSFGHVVHSILTCRQRQQVNLDLTTRRPTSSQLRRAQAVPFHASRVTKLSSSHNPTQTCICLGPCSNLQMIRLTARAALEESTTHGGIRDVDLAATHYQAASTAVAVSSVSASNFCTQNSI
ncbi:hypothetical protein BBO_06229 [Beauveria brongniartii RCEF 3172]|uniref:Uncharacterized protein n=1 Tax=Beauveria brongniartii RCEF 3172 TaxID=1081107 RepID=A0A167BLG7_9HYPO|nr:hypothetical protein BBO_06229 [Beauveria brongniartii RCEF 3172]